MIDLYWLRDDQMCGIARILYFAALLGRLGSRRLRA